MRTKELTASLVILQRVLADPRLEPAQEETLRKGLKELKKVRQSGSMNRSDVFRAVSLISRTLHEVVARIPDPLPLDEVPPQAQRAR
jgi:hypothetical protein